MDRYGWLKSVTQLSNVCSASPVNNQILFFSVHEVHFDDRALRKLKCVNKQPFVLKAGDSNNDQTNYNGPNFTLKSMYNDVKDPWMLKYGTTKFFLTT